MIGGRQRRPEPACWMEKRRTVPINIGGTESRLELACWMEKFRTVPMSSGLTLRRTTSPCCTAREPSSMRSKAVTASPLTALTAACETGRQPPKYSSFIIRVPNIRDLKSRMQLYGCMKCMRTHSRMHCCVSGCGLMDPSTMILMYEVKQKTVLLTST